MVLTYLLIVLVVLSQNSVLMIVFINGFRVYGSKALDLTNRI